MAAVMWCVTCMSGVVLPGERQLHLSEVWSQLHCQLARAALMPANPLLHSRLSDEHVCARDVAPRPCMLLTVVVCRSELVKAGSGTAAHACASCK